MIRTPGFQLEPLENTLGTFIFTLIFKETLSLIVLTV